LEIAAELGIEERVIQALRERTAVASVGPVMTATLESREIRPDIIPNHPKMGSLVKAAAETAQTALSLKRAARVR
jgi:uroporphyrinogen-III synthase